MTGSYPLVYTDVSSSANTTSCHGFKDHRSVKSAESSSTNILTNIDPCVPGGLNQQLCTCSHQSLHAPPSPNWAAVLSVSTGNTSWRTDEWEELFKSRSFNVWSHLLIPLPHVWEEVLLRKI